jgi:type II secretory pathway component PulF
MITTPFSYFFPYYVKKEDVKEFALKYRKTIGIVLLACFMVVAIIQIVVSPKLANFYKDFNQSIPLTTQYSNLVSIILGILFLCISIYFFITPPNYKKIDGKLSKYKAGEMIRTREIIEPIYVFLTLTSLGIMIGFLVLTNILPIYSLTNSYK